MSWRPAIIASAAALVLLTLAWALVWRVEGWPWETPRAREAIGGSGGAGSAIGIDPASVVSISTGGVEVSRESPGRPWYVRAGGADWPAIGGEVQAALRRLQTARFEPIEAPVSGEASVVVVTEVGGRETVLRFGDGIAAGRTAATVEGDGGVRSGTTSATVRAGLSRGGLLEWRERSVEALAGAGVSRLVVERGGERVVLDLGPNGWRMREPALGARAHTPLIRGLLRAVGGISVDDLADDPGTAPIRSVTLEGERSVRLDDLGSAGVAGDRRRVRLVLGGSATLAGEVLASVFPDVPTDAAGYVDPRPVPWAEAETGRVEIGRASIRRAIDGWSSDGEIELVPGQVERLTALAARLGEGAPVWLVGGAARGEPIGTLRIARIGGSDSVEHELREIPGEAGATLVLREGGVERTLAVNAVTLELLRSLAAR